MRSLQHVFWRGVIALGLSLGAGAGLWSLPRASAAPCEVSAVQAQTAAGLTPRSPPAASTGTRC